MLFLLTEYDRERSLILMTTKMSEQTETVLGSFQAYGRLRYVVLQTWSFRGRPQYTVTVRGITTGLGGRDYAMRGVAVRNAVKRLAGYGVIWSSEAVA